MAYEPRYYKPFVGTTETYATKSVTQDKLADGVITTPKIAPDAITSPKIKDEEIRSEDVKDGEIKTPDLGLKSVTREKLANDAVGTFQIGDREITGSKIALGTLTPDLFSEAQVTRPLTPGVGTNEIQDGKVTHPKLAEDAVETVNIKNANVTGPKIANATITEANLAANSVGGIEIKDGVVSTIHLSTDAVETPKIKNLAVTQEKLAGESVGTPQLQDGSVTTPKIQNAAVIEEKIANGHITAIKLATDAVETIKIKDLNVTASKLHDDALVDRLIESLLSRRQIYYEDFVGAVLRDDWAVNGDAGFTVDLYQSNVRLSTAATINSVVRLNWNGRLVYQILRQKPILVVMNISSPNTGESRWRLGLRFNDDNYVAFEYDTSVDNKFRAVCRSGGVSTSEDTGITISDSVQRVLKIEIISNTEVKFYVDGTLTNTIATNIPTSILEAHAEVENLIAAFRSFNLDKFLIIANPYWTAPP